MATTEPGISPPATTSEVGRHLRTVRKARGLSRSEVARSAGLTRRELAAYERGRVPVPDSDLWCLAGSCGVDVTELLPSRDKLAVSSELGSLTVGDSIARLRAGSTSDGLLREYLAMIYELRNLPPGTRPPIREEDLAALAETLGGTPEAIEARLHELIGVSRDEAARLRSMILPPRSLPAASAAPLSDLSEYATTPFTPFDAPIDAPVEAEAPAFDFAMASTSVGDPDATDRFFAAPLVDDPFASPLPLEPLEPFAPLAEAPAAPAAPTAPTAPDSVSEPSTMDFDPFAPPTAAPIDPFAPPTAAPIDPFASPLDADVSPALSPMDFDPFGPLAVPTETPFDAPDPASAPSPMDFDPFAPVAMPTETPFDAPDLASASSTLDTGTFDAGTFDPATFDPAAFTAGAVTDSEVAGRSDRDAFGTDEATDTFVVDRGDDSALEIVALSANEPPAPTPEPTEVAPVDAVAAPPEESWLATWETLSEHGNGADPSESDPFAALRVPLDEVYGADVEAAAMLDPFGPEPGFITPATPATPAVGAEVRADVTLGVELPVPAVEPDEDPFADAFEPLGEPVPSLTPELAVEATPAPVASSTFADALDDDPDGEWFDRAAAATAALVADHLQAEGRGGPEATGAIHDTDTDTDAEIDLDEDAEIDIDEVDIHEPDIHEPGIHEPAAMETVTEPAPVAEAPDDDAPEVDLESDLDDALVAAPVAGLAPIAWSLFPAAATEVAGDGADATPDAHVDADDVAPDSDESSAVDTQFVAAGTNWQIGGIFPATAMADDGALALRRADVRWALADLVSSDDFTARATVDFTSGAGFGILFRVTVDDAERISGYSFDVDPIYGGGGFLLRQWHDNRQHWKPLAHAPVADPTRLYGQHTIEVQLRADQLTASVDGDVVLTVRQLSRCSIDSGREPCRGARLGVQAWSTTEVTVDRLLLAT